MRFLVLTALLLAAPVVHAEAPATPAKPNSGFTYGEDDGGQVKGKVQRPGVGIVIPRDPAAKKTIDKSREQALKEAAERIK